MEPVSQVLDTMGLRTPQLTVALPYLTHDYRPFAHLLAKLAQLWLECASVVLFFVFLLDAICIFARLQLSLAELVYSIHPPRQLGRSQYPFAVFIPCLLGCERRLGLWPLALSASKSKVVFVLRLP